MKDLPTSPVIAAMRKKPLMEIDLTWHGLTAWVIEKEPGIFKSTSKRKLVLNNVSGAVRSGTLAAVMGPSGAGKTSLLSALANRLKGEVRGDIRINGWPADGDILRLSAFIPQENLFIETLTTIEHLEFMVGLRYHFYNFQERKKRVNELLTELGLQPCQHTPITQLSGGQRKRLIFASEIVTDPPLIFVDEPSSGLDSFSAQTVISLLEELAKRGRTVICSIHQPSSQVFSAFNDLILLADGRVAFSGKRSEAGTFFSTIGYEVPDNYNPADFFMRILATQNEANRKMSFEDDERKREFDIANAFAASSSGINLGKMIQDLHDTTFLSSFPNQMALAVKEMERQGNLIKGQLLKLHPPGWKQLWWLTQRSIRDSLRNPSVHAIRTAHKVMTSLIIALCFGGLFLDQKGIQDVEGALFMFLTENNFPSCYAVLQVFPAEIPVFIREQRAGLYRTDIYYISKILSLIPGFILEPLVFTSIAYYGIGLRADSFAFLITALTVTLTANVAFAYGCLLSVAFDSIEKSTLLMIPINQIILLAAGLYVNVKTIPVYISWIKYSSWMMYSNEALNVIQWNGVKNIDCDGADGVPCIRTGAEVLESLNFDPSDLWVDLMALLVIFLIFHLIGIGCLTMRARAARAGNKRSGTPTKSTPTNLIMRGLNFIK